MRENETNEVIQSRREFFKHAAKKALPILGSVTIMSIPALQTKAVNKGSCDGSCTNTCVGGCTGSCSGSCSGSCTGCSGSCSGTCMASCGGTSTKSSN